MCLLSLLPPHRRPAPAEKPRSGGVLLFTGGDLPSQDPHQETTWIVVRTVGPSYNSLIEYDPAKEAGVLKGDLAERWEVSKDGTVITFYLRKGVKWHDGQPFTSADVVYSLKRIQSPPEGVVSPWKLYLAGIDIVALDDSP